MDRELISVRRYRSGYEVRTEMVSMGDDTPIEMKSAYNMKGHYIGSSVWGHRLVQLRGVMPELSHPDHNVCSVGFCEREHKWYGWSHRAMYGFGIGDEVQEGSACAESGWIEEYLIEHPDADRSLPVGFHAESLDDCRRMAVAFADAVS